MDLARSVEDQSDEEVVEEIRDILCFACGKQDHKDKSLFMYCPCRKAYHVYCLTKLKDYPSPLMTSTRQLFKCQECQVDETTNIEAMKNLPPEKVKAFIESMCHSWVKWIGESKDAADLKGFITAMDKELERQELGKAEDYPCIQKPIDLRWIYYYSLEKAYNTVEALVCDIKHITHNSTLLFGRNNVETKNCIIFEKLCFQDLNTTFSDGCVSCLAWDCMYANRKKTVESTKAFLEACEIPHPVAWVKMPGFPWWPAKIFYNDKEEGTMQGLFFQDGTTTGKVKLANCLMYALKHPEPRQIKTKGQREKLREAEREALEYIQNVREKFNYEQTVNVIRPFRNFSAEFYKELYNEMPGEDATKLAAPKTPFEFK